MDTAAGENPLRRWGWVARQPSRSVVFWVADAAWQAEAVRAARAVQHRYPRTHVVFVQPPGLRRDHGYPAFDPPLTFGVRLLLARLRARVVILAGTDDRETPAVIRMARARAAGAVLLRRSSDGPAAASPEADRGNHWRARVDAELDVAAVEGAAAGAPDQSVVRLDALMTRSRRQELEKQGHAPMAIRGFRWLRNGPLSALFAMQFHEYRSIDELRRALGNPATILCLGNGPSSEHPQVAAIQHDRLFRVNMSWATRGLLVEPDLVFTGMAETVAALRPRVGFVFGRIQSEEKILGGLLKTRRRVAFATVERLGLLHLEPGQEVAPTNGALMLAVAAACQPRELVVAGIDLYRHPEGAYPGDSRTENAYAVGHAADVDLQFMLAALRDYRGKLVIVGDALREALAAST